MLLCFQQCLGALDGMHIRAQVPAKHKGRYQNRKGELTTNVLGVCLPDRQFIFVSPGWEGSIANGKVLRDDIKKPHKQRVPQGKGVRVCELVTIM